MERTLEPELMEEEAQAEAYARADFADVNAAFVEQVLAIVPGLSGAIVDLGAGPADIPIRLCRAAPSIRVTAVDGSEAMLAQASANVARAVLGDRIELVLGRLPRALPAERRFDVVISNSLLHHLPDPSVLWDEIVRLGKPGAPVLVVDLMRPASREDARAIVDRYAGSEPEVLRTDFFNSLLAAFTLEEVEAQLREHGLAGALTVEASSDRHLRVSGRLR